MCSIELKSTNILTVKKSFISHLKKSGNSGFARSSQRFFPEKIVCYGIRAEELRGLCRKIYQQVRSDWTVDEALELAEALLQGEELESRLGALIFLGYFKDGLQVQHLEIFESWLKKNRLDNWALIDTFSLEILSPFLLRHPACLNKIEAWIRDKNVYLKRAGLVGLIKPARKNLHLSFIFRLASLAVSSGPVEDLVAKAAGWLLREAGRFDAKQLEDYLKRHGKKWPRLTVRYALEKFPVAKRKHLLQITKNNS